MQKQDERIRREMKSRPIKQIALNTLLIVTTVSLMLLIGEGITRALFWRSLDFDMEMWKYATQVKVADPSLGHKHGPDRQAYLMGVDVTTNRFGLRGDDTTLTKPANTYRILVVGDSLTMGWGVEQDLTFAADLERRMNANPPAGFPSNVLYEVLNLGIGNYNTVQEVMLLKSLGLQFKPDLILLFYFINDAEPINESRDSYLIRHSYLYAFLASRLRRSPLGETGSLGYKEYYRLLYKSGQPGWLAGKAAFKELGELVRVKNIPVVIYLLPELHELTAYPFLDIHQMVAKVGAAVGLPVIDLLPKFSGYAPEVKLWVTPADAHPNALANTMIARGIYNSLSRVRAVR